MKVGDIIEGLREASYHYARTVEGTRWAVATIGKDRLGLVPPNADAVKNYLIGKARKDVFFVYDIHFKVVGRLEIDLTNEDVLARLKESGKMKKMDDYLG